MPERTFRLVKFRPKRTFGCELEFTNQSNREFLARCIQQVGESARVNGYQHDCSETTWSCKTDSSCGNEIASRILGSGSSIRKCIHDLNILHDVTKALQDANARVSNSCGTHVHVSVADFEEAKLKNVLAYWIRLEKTITDMMPQHRKNNSYCPTSSKYFEPDRDFSFRDLVNRGFRDRGALNWRWYTDRRTVEFRIAEGTTNPHDVKNWTRFLLHFIERCKIAETASSLNWLTLEDSLKFLDLWNDEEDPEFRILSPALAELRLWILTRTQQHAGYRDADKIREKIQCWLQGFQPQEE